MTKIGRKLSPERISAILLQAEHFNQYPIKENKNIKK